MNLTNLDLETVLLCLKCNTFGFMQLLWWSRFKCWCFLHQSRNQTSSVSTPWMCVIAVVREVIVHHSNQSQSSSVWQVQQPPSYPDFPALPHPSPSSLPPYNLSSLSLQPRPAYTLRVHREWWRKETLKPIIWHKQGAHRSWSGKSFVQVLRTSTERHVEGCATYYSGLFTWSSMSRMSRVTTMLTAFPRLESWNSLATWPPGKQEKTSLKNSWYTSWEIELRQH